MAELKRSAEEMKRDARQARWRIVCRAGVLVVILYSISALWCSLLYKAPVSHSFIGVSQFVLVPFSLGSSLSSSGSPFLHVAALALLTVGLGCALLFPSHRWTAFAAYATIISYFSYYGLLLPLALYT